MGVISMADFIFSRKCCGIFIRLDDIDAMNDYMNEIALKQIEEKQYVAQLVERGIPAERIRKYGFAFEGKNVLIG